MGTNFYYHSELDVCPSCGHIRGKKQHIGKSSGGWCFALHVDEEAGVTTLAQLQNILIRPDITIEDEYGHVVSYTRMMQIIMDRSHPVREFVPDRWYSSKEEFLRKNNAVDGPNGLFRHAIDGVHCVGHGEGTWDYITGEFS